MYTRLLWQISIYLGIGHVAYFLSARWPYLLLHKVLRIVAWRWYAYRTGPIEHRVAEHTRSDNTSRTPLSTGRIGVLDRLREPESHAS